MMRDAQRKCFAILLLVMAAAATVPMVPRASAQQSVSNVVQGVIESTLQDTWEDSKWVFYETYVAQYELLHLELEYQGDLDLNIWVFVDNKHAELEEQTATGWDITHCGIREDTYKPVAYSEIYTTDTSETGPEIVEYTNFDQPIQRHVVILIFSRYGVGTSNYTLTASNQNQTLAEIPKNRLKTCWTVQQAWTLFIGGLIIFSTIFIILVKRATRTEEKKAEIRAKKERKKQEKIAKLKAKGKKVKSSTSMAARASRVRKRR